MLSPESLGGSDCDKLCEDDSCHSLWVVKFPVNLRAAALSTFSVRFAESIVEDEGGDFLFGLFIVLCSAWRRTLVCFVSYRFLDYSLEARSRRWWKVLVEFFRYFPFKHVCLYCFQGGAENSLKMLLGGKLLTLFLAEATRRNEKTMKLDYEAWNELRDWKHNEVWYISFRVEIVSLFETSELLRQKEPIKSRNEITFVNIKMLSKFQRVLMLIVSKIFSSASFVAHRWSKLFGEQTNKKLRKGKFNSSND